jgi:hypothetical protein
MLSFFCYVVVPDHVMKLIIVCWFDGFFGGPAMWERGYFGTGSSRCDFSLLEALVKWCNEF